jgi:AraC-like DNA-binding protein
MDVLSDVLGTVRLESSVMARTELAAPWGIRADAQDRFAFHLLGRGTAWLEVEGCDPIEVAAGDVAVIAPGRGHTMRDSRTTRARPVSEWIASGDFACTPASADAQLVCGWFRFESPGAEMLRAALPPVVHTRDLGDAAPWLGRTIELIVAESAIGAERAPGSETVVNRLCDALFVYVLRAHLARIPEGEPNWLRALVEPGVGASLRLMHERPGEPWTVAALAAEVGMSRSAFAARFGALVGESPIEYLTRWRLRKAAGMLRGGSAGIAEVASRVGYESEASFNRAFKRWIGRAPGAYRREAR